MSPILPILFLLAWGPVSAADQENLDIVGTWEFVSATTIEDDGTKTEFTTNDLRSMKILNQTHFSVVTRTVGGLFRHANIGRYRREGHLYSEILEYSTDPNWTGVTVDYSYRVEGDLWYIDTTGYGYPKVSEVWRRVRGTRAPVEF